MPIEIKGAPVWIQLRGEVRKRIEIKGEKPKIGITGLRKQVVLKGERPKVGIRGNWKGDQGPSR
jgi:hypothetical protein